LEEQVVTFKAPARKDIILDNPTLLMFLGLMDNTILSKEEIVMIQRLAI
jgi:hypothetical protein